MEPAALVILVGGRARRLHGADKARLVTQDRTFVEAMVERLRPLVAEVVLAGAEAGAYADLGLESVPDARPGQGPLGGLAAGLAAIRSPRAFVCACDMPGVRPDVVTRILQVQGSRDAAVPVLGGRAEPLHAVYAKSCGPLAAGLPGRSLRDLLERMDCLWLDEAAFADLPGWRDSFANVNTPEDLERLGGVGTRARERGPVPPVISLVAPCNGSGKSRLAVEILRAFPGLAAVKVSTIYRDGGNCPRHPGHGCACTRLGRADFRVLDDPGLLAQPETDTGDFVAAGARCLWVVCRPGSHQEAWAAVRAAMPGEAVLTEGSRVAEVCSPDLLVAVVNPFLPREGWKEGSDEVLRAADLCLVNRHGPAGPEVPLPDRPLLEWSGTGLPEALRDRLAGILAPRRPTPAPGSSSPPHTPVAEE